MLMPQQFAPSIKGIIIVEPVANGDAKVTEVYKPEGKGKRGSRRVRPLEKMARRLAEAQQIMVNDYLARHERSNEKKKDGWLRDMGNNVFKAVSKGGKKFKKIRSDFEDD
jgi:hypothetical protein